MKEKEKEEKNVNEEESSFVWNIRFEHGFLIFPFMMELLISFSVIYLCKDVLSSDYFDMKMIDGIIKNNKILPLLEVADSNSSTETFNNTITRFNGLVPGLKYLLALMCIFPLLITFAAFIKHLWTFTKRRFLSKSRTENALKSTVKPFIMSQLMMTTLLFAVVFLNNLENTPLQLVTVFMALFNFIGLYFSSQKNKTLSINTKNMILLVVVLVDALVSSYYCGISTMFLFSKVAIIQFICQCMNYSLIEIDVTDIKEDTKERFNLIVFLTTFNLILFTTINFNTNIIANLYLVKAGTLNFMVLFLNTKLFDYLVKTAAKLIEIP